jgi:hypothetical protein
MKEIFADHDFTKVGFFRSVLEEAQIPCFIRNEHTHSVFTGIPSPLFYPALCITKDEDFDRAKALLEEHRHPDVTVGVNWKCPACGEEVPGEFESCWNCEALRPA